MRRILRNNRGASYIDICVMMLCIMLVLGLAVKVLPVYVAKQQLDTFATELCREAEIAGRIGKETDRRTIVLEEKTGLTPNITWSQHGNVQLNQEFTITLECPMDLGRFGGFGSFPVTLQSKAMGKSEVYWK